MKISHNWLIACFLLCFALTGVTLAQQQERDLNKEEKLRQQLQKIAPKAVNGFKAATNALDEKNYEESARLYNEVLAQAPNFEPALRRLGFALIGIGKRDEGLKMSQKALALNRSSDNLFSYALALTERGVNNYQPTETELEQALALSKEAMQKDTENDSDYAIAVADFALSLNREQDFRDASRFLAEKYPDLIATHYFNSIRLANDGNFAAAEAEIRKAESLGLPPEAAQEILSGIERAKRGEYQSGNAPNNSFIGDFRFGAYFYYGLYLVGTWALGLLTLFVAGKILSVKTLRSIENSDPNDITGGGQEGLRKIYKNVITIAGIYYYLSQPVVMLLVVVAVLGTIMFFLWLGWIPVKLLLILVLVGAVTIFYMIKSLLVRNKTDDPGRALREDEAPQLWALTRDVAKAINTRPVDEIRLTPGSELAVYERGSIRMKMQDKAERILIIGVATLNDFSQNAFRAVLAHEYGHFSNRDTAGGAVALRVENDIIRLAEAMAQNGTATVYNIAFQFLRVYHFLFRRITHGATRLQEILADRVAVHQYGADAFREGLTHVVRRGVEFNHLAAKEINAAYNSNRSLQNLYEMTEQDETVRKNLEQEFNEAINSLTTEDDTHPSPQDRFKLANQIKSKESLPINGMVWDLFKDRESLTKEMNQMLETIVRANL
ncbi:MAG TPA: M48 family metalloprotease [Pyrinomonadaceae bacterium]|jgi:Zn-dependent protease with chaperone function